MIEKAVELRPEDGYIVDSLGWAHYRMGDYAGAVEYLERAVELVPEDPTINDHLGDAYWRTGRLTEARYQWRRALQFGPRQGRDQADRGQARTRASQPGRRRPPAPAPRAPNRRGARRLSEPAGAAVAAFAPAKINLYLHVVGRRADGYHLLDSLVAFADIGDEIAAAPADALSLDGRPGRRRRRSPGSATTIWCCAPPAPSPRITASRARRRAAPRQAACRSPPGSAAGRAMRRRRCARSPRCGACRSTTAAMAHRRRARRRCAGLPRGARRSGSAASASGSTRCRRCRRSASCSPTRGALPTAAVFRARQGAFHRRRGSPRAARDAGGADRRCCGSAATI